MFQQTIARIAIMAVALGGGAAMQTEFGPVAESVLPLPAEEARPHFLIAEEGTAPSPVEAPLTSAPSAPDLVVPPPLFEGGQPPVFIPSPPEGGEPRPLPEGTGDGRRFESQGPREEGMMPRFEGENFEPPEPPHEECRKQMKQAGLQMERMVKGIERKLANIKRQGISPSGELSELIQKLKDVISRAKTIEGCDDSQEIGEEIGPLMGDLQEKIQELEQCAFLPRMKKEITRQHNFIKRDWSRVQARVKKVKNVDLSELLNEGGALYSKLEEMKNQAIAKIDEIIKSGDCGQAEDLFEVGEEARDIEMELRENINTLMALVDAPRQFNFLKRERKSFDRSIRELKRKKVEVSELESCLAEFDTTLSTIKGVLGEKPLDPENLRDAFELGEDVRNRCREIADGLHGVQAFEVPDVFGDLETPQFLPRGF